MIEHLILEKIERQIEYLDNIIDDYHRFSDEFPFKDFYETLKELNKNFTDFWEESKNICPQK